MCGIAAYLGEASPDEARELVGRADAALRHRGVDGSRILVWDGPAGRLWTEDESGRTETRDDLAERPARVVIAARSGHLGSAGPTVGPDGMSIALDGTFYDLDGLRARLGGEASDRASIRDADVLLAAYRRWGPDFVRDLEGDFAMIIVDPKRGQVLVARDIFGVRPLFSRRLEHGILFASEVAALAGKAWGPARADPERVVSYLVEGMSGGQERTMLTGVNEVTSGTLATWSPESPATVSAERVRLTASEVETGMSFDEAVREIRERFLTSVEQRLRGGGPVGVILSGGLDSTAVVMALRKVGGRNLDIHTASYIGEHGARSEEVWIDEVNRVAGCNAHKLRIAPSTWSFDPEVALRQGEPHGSLAIHLQRQLFASLAEAGVRVAHGGVGSDAILCGRPTFWGAHLAGMLGSKRYGEAARFLRRISSSRPGGGSASRATLLRTILWTFPKGLREGIVRMARRKPWVSPEYLARHNLQLPTPFRPGGATALRESVLHGIGHHLPVMFRYADRNAAAYGVECRHAFVSRRLVSFAAGLPPDYLIGPDGQPKRVFVEAMRGLVPSSVLDRRDFMGFEVPVRAWALQVPDLRARLGTADLPPVAAGTTQRLVRASQEQTLGPRDAWMFWRILGLWEWARAFGVEEWDQALR